MITTTNETDSFPASSSASASLSEPETVSRDRLVTPCADPHETLAPALPLSPSIHQSINGRPGSGPSIHSRSLRFVIPSPDLDTFANDLKPRARKLVLRRLKAMRAIHRCALRFADGRRAGKSVRELQSVWDKCVEIEKQFHMERGWSAKRLHQIYLEFIASGDWRSLVDASIAGPAWQNSIINRTLPAPFLIWFAQQVASNQRGKLAPAYAGLLSRLGQWRAGDHASAIPGYAEPPAPGANSAASAQVNCDLPDGWTYSNLSRAVKPFLSKFARAHIRIGPKAASALGPQIPGTRVGLPVGKYVLIDDSWNDFKVIAKGQSCRLLSFHILELLSGCNVARGYKPALRTSTASPSSDQPIEERLKERELVWLIVHYFTAFGYHPSGTQIIGEKATACLRERELQIFADCDIPITFNSGPAGGGAGISALFTGPGGGNPRWKAPLESWFNLLRNRTASLLEFPGQTGSNARLNCPEGLPGLEKDTAALIKAAKTLPPEKAELLRLGQLGSHEAIFKLDALTEVLNCRTDHDLGQWRECGHYTHEFRLRPDMAWQPATKLLEYDPAEREAIAAVLNQVRTLGGSRPSATTSLTRERALSPREVFDAGARDLVRLPLAVAALLIDDLEGTERPVKNNCLELMVPEVDPDAPLQFGLARRDGRGTHTPLRNDEKYLVKVNPLDPRVAWLYDSQRKFAGVADYYGRVQRDQPEQLKAAFARKKAALAPLLEEAHRLAAPIIQAETDRAAHNAEILADAASGRAESEARARANRRKAASMF